MALIHCRYMLLFQRTVTGNSLLSSASFILVPDSYHSGLGLIRTV